MEEGGGIGLDFVVGAAGVGLVVECYGYMLVALIGCCWLLVVKGVRTGVMELEVVV